MQDIEFDAIRAAVTIAKDEQVRTIPALLSRLVARGFTSEAAQSAIHAWAQHEVMQNRLLPYCEQEARNVAESSAL